MAVGIIGYGACVPMYRIKVEEIAKAWGGDAEAIKRGLMIEEKSVPSPDEDTATIAVEAAKNALARAEIDPQKIECLFIGSESHPYAVKPTASIVAEALGVTPDLTAADFEFACKAGTTAIQAAMGLVGSGTIEYGMGGGVDTSQSAPGDALEHTAAAGGAMFILGTKNLAAEIVSTYSFTTDTPDFWRREGQAYPRHGGRFTGEPAYFKHVLSATRGLLEKAKMKVEDFDHVVFHMPNGKFPTAAAKKLGVSQEQLKEGFVVPKIGNTYSGCSPLGLTRVLDNAKADQKILVTSYGSGAGSDSFYIKTTKRLPTIVKKAKKTQDYIDCKKYIDYTQYVKYRGKLKL